MHNRQLEPNKFELTLLGRVLSEHPDAGFAISDLQMLSREFTGAGSFTEFKIEGPPRPTARRVLDTRAVVAIPRLKCGLGVVAFLEGNKLTLETFSFGGEPWDGVSDGFVIGMRP